MIISKKKSPSKDSNHYADLSDSGITCSDGRLLKDKDARGFYEAECIKSGWSVNQLQRQIGSFLWERLTKSSNKDEVLRLANEGHEVFQAEDLIKDPYILEFTGLPEKHVFKESELETALIDRLQSFLLELGRDLHLVARQKRITLEGDHFSIDLVFYHRTLRCFLLIDLKTGKLTQQDIGQMLLYTGYYEMEVTREDENPPIGLILCADKNESMVKYTLAKNNQQIFASKYHLHLPSEEELRAELVREREAIEAQMIVEEEDQ